MTTGSQPPANAPARIVPRVAEQRALDAALPIAASGILCTTLGRAQAAYALACQRPEGNVTCWFLDLFVQELARAHCQPRQANLSLSCLPDPPADPVDLAVIPFNTHGESELGRNVLQAACERLAIGGSLVAAVDNPNDRWLHEQLAELFAKVTVQSHADAVVYIARKTAEPRRHRDFRCQFAFRDAGRLIHAVSRPGVFAHRRLDGGARQLLGAAEVAPGMRVLDIGCGTGTVGLALAARQASAAVHAIDSNARAIECKLAGAALNDLANVTAELNCDGRLEGDATYDLAVANPPYFADTRIAEHFLATARRALRPGGRVLVVAKRPDWYEAIMPAQWYQVENRPAKQYCLISALRP